MINYLVLRFVPVTSSSVASPPSAAQQTMVQWALVDTSGRLQQRGTQPLSELPAVLTAEQLLSPCILLVPGEKVRITQVRIPSTNAKKIHQALPFAVEELIAEELETTHLATGDIKRTNNGLIDVAIVRHQLIIEWIDLCHQFAITPHYIFPDSLCIPWEANSWSFFYDASHKNPRVLVRSANLNAQVVSASLAGMLLSEMVQASNKRQDIIVKPQVNFYAPEAAAEPFKSWRQTLPPTADHDQRDVLFREDAFEVVALQAVTRVDSLINLRQGGYRVPVDVRSSSRSWRQAAVAAAVGCILFALASVGKAFWYDAQRDVVEKQAVALYKEIYPGSTRVFNPRRQMESALLGNDNTGVAGDDEFVETLLDITEVIASSQNAEVFIQTLLFSAEQPEAMTMSMIVGQDDALDEMRERLSQTDLRLEVKKTSPVSNGVAVDFRLLRGQ